MAEVHELVCTDEVDQTLSTKNGIKKPLSR